MALPSVSGTEPEKGHLLVTGAAGYIGRVLVARALASGWRVTALSRTAPGGALGQPRCGFIPYDLARPLDAAALEGAGKVDAVVHLAADTRIDERGPGLFEEDEIAAARALLAVASAGGARFIFVSSQSAGAGAETRYSRVKRRIEEVVAGAGGYIVRPGMVYGGAQAAGLFGTLCGLVARSPVIPALRPAPRVQPIHIADLCDGMLTLAGTPALPPGRYDIADPDPVPFDRFLAAIARHRLRRSPLLVPVPYALLAAAARIAACVPILPTLDLGRVEALRRLPAMDTRPSLAVLGLTTRPLADGMRPSGRARRRLAAEGAALFRYLGGAAPGKGLVRRYVRAIEAVDDGAPLDLPAPMLAMPALLRLIDAFPGATGRPRLRLNMAAALLEATPAGDALFVARHARGMLPTAVGIGLTLVADGVALVLSPLAKWAWAKRACLDGTHRAR